AGGGRGFSRTLPRQLVLLDALIRRVVLGGDAQVGERRDEQRQRDEGEEDQERVTVLATLRAHGSTSACSLLRAAPLQGPYPIASTAYATSTWSKNDQCVRAS